MCARSLLRGCVAPTGAPSAASLRRRAALSAADPSHRWVARTVSELLAGGLSAPERCPGAARASCLARARGAGAAPDPASRSNRFAPLDGASGKEGI